MKFNNDPAFLKKRAEAYKQKQADPNFGSSNRDYIFTKSVIMYKGRDGDNAIRILPNPDPEAMFPWLSLFIHYRIGVNESQYLCLAKMKNMPCPICEEHKRVKDSDMAEQAKSEALSRLYAAERATVYLIDRLETDSAKNPQIWPMPAKKVAENLLGLSFESEDNSPLFIDDPKNGYDIFFKRTGKDRATDYKSIRIARNSSPVHEDTTLATKWLSVVDESPLHKILNFKNYDYIKAVLNGEDPNLEVSSKPITSAASKAKAKVKHEEVSTATDSSLDNIPVGEGLNLEQISQMKRAELVKLIEDRNLSLNPDEWEDEDLAQAVSLELGITA